MSNGGKREGAGRPKGSKTKLNILDFSIVVDNIEEILEMTVKIAKTKEGTKERLFLIEQVYGKAKQSVDMGVSFPDTLIQLIKDGNANETGNIEVSGEDTK